MKNIIDKKTGVFLRNDYTCTEMEKIIETTIPYDIYAVMGICPLWDGEKWLQNVKPPILEEIPQEPSLEERIQALEAMELERILGGGF